jgi:protein-S-isoprenylcysteine O-methyltransferase Ste14
MTDETTQTKYRTLLFLYGAAAYALFLFTFTYTIGFVGNLVVPKSIDVGGETGSLPEALLINALLLSAFVVQHTIMARRGFKAWWTRFVPAPIERATFVLVTCLILLTAYWLWRPVPTVIWSVESTIGRTALYGLFAIGWFIVLYASFLIDHFELFGLRQVVQNLRGQPHTRPEFVTPWLYRRVRNPLMLGFIIAFWSTPHMTVGHLQFALMTTGYIFFGVFMEERDLLAILGENYRRYRARTPMLLPWPRPAGDEYMQAKSPSVLPDVGSAARGD